MSEDSYKNNTIISRKGTVNMKISVAAKGPDANALIPSTLAKAKYLLIFDGETLELINVYPNETDKVDVYFATKTVDENCEAILCGDIMEEAFEILAGNGVTRYLASEKPAYNALVSMNNYQLPLIRDYDGGPGCGEDSHGECNCDVE